MSAANVALVKRSYEVINSIGRTGSEFVDPEELAPDLWTKVAPDFELHERSDLPDAKAYRGRDETKQFWRKPHEARGARGGRRQRLRPRRRPVAPSGGASGGRR